MNRVSIVNSFKSHRFHSNPVGVGRCRGGGRRLFPSVTGRQAGRQGGEWQKLMAGRPAGRWADWRGGRRENVKNFNRARSIENGSRGESSEHLGTFTPVDQIE